MDMLSFADALDVVMKSARLTGSERVGFRHSMNRILAEDVYSDIDMPAFDRSMVDGYACRREDLGNGLKVIETIKAGVIPSRRIMRGQCAKIMTGAMVPPGADCVVMVELARGGDVVEFAGSEPKENICRKGRDLKAGQVVLRKGSLIRAQHIAVLASVGQVEVAVARRPSVGIIATGDELVEPEVKPVMSQVRNSNSAQLAAQVEEAGGIVQDYGVAGDEPVGIDRRLKKAMNDNEVILVSGGVSVGDSGRIMSRCFLRRFRLSRASPLFLAFGKAAVVLDCREIPWRPLWYSSCWSSRSYINGWVVNICR
jgi:molybdopterin molybdotransferase